MSITLKLQTCTSDDRVVNKTVTDITSVTATIKENCSIIDPVFIVSGSVSTFALCNYCTVTNFGGRKYFVNDIKTLANGITELHCHCDVLSSYAAAIINLDAVIERQENDFNLYLDDGSFKVYSDPIIQTKEYASGFSSPCIVLGIVGG